MDRADIFGMLTKLGTITRDINAAAMWAGVTAFVWYAFGAVPLHIAVASQLGPTADQSSSWIFIIWTSGAVASIALSVYDRMPEPITWSIPGLICLGTLVGEFTFADISAANLVAGVLILVLGILGGGGKIIRWLPLPIVMGMFAGVSSATSPGLLTSRWGTSRWPARRWRIPSGTSHRKPAGAAGRPYRPDRRPSYFGGHALESAFPSGSQHVLPSVFNHCHQSAHGCSRFRVRQHPVTGISDRPGIPRTGDSNLHRHRNHTGDKRISGRAPGDCGSDRGSHLGRPRCRTQGAAVLGQPYGCNPHVDHPPAAGLVIPILAVLPASYIFALVGLAIFASLQDAFQKAFRGNLVFGAVVAFAVASTPFSYMGITSALWAVLAGWRASLIAEREQFLALWREGASQANQS